MKFYPINMMRIFKMLSLVAVLALGACKNESSDRFIIEGSISGAAGEVVKLIEFTLEAAITIDSVTIGEDGKFKISAAGTEPTVYMLTLANAGLLPLLAENGDKITVNTTADQYLVAAEIVGSRGSEELLAYFREFNNFQERVAELNAALMPFSNLPEFEEKRAEAQEKYTALESFQKNYVKSFIKENKTSVVPVFASLYAANFISPESEFEWYLELLERFQAEFPNSKYTSWLSQYVEPYRNLAELSPGKQAPDFKLATPEGDSLSLSDLRGKYVLIDFWASWCAPCRQENPRVVKMYERFKGKNFEILGVSLDREREGWVKAIKDDQLAWKHVSDLKFWDSMVTGLYAIQSIPATMIVDPEGKIVARNLRGTELEDKLASLLN
jgi:peroxiredoxin